MTFCFPNWKGGLKEIAHPELGIYECTEARLGNADYLRYFSYIHLELKRNGECVFHYAEKDGEKRERRGKYEYDGERGTLLLKGGSLEREFPLKEGVLTVVLRMGTQTLSLIFEQK